MLVFPFFDNDSYKVAYFLDIYFVCIFMFVQVNISFS